MKKNLTLITILLAMSVSVSAQDIITLRNGDEVRARIVEISNTELRFRLYEHPAGPVRVTPISEVFAITYEDGTREVFNPLTETRQAQAVFDPNLTSGMLTLNGVRVFQDGRRLSNSEVRHVMATNFGALTTFNRGRNQRVWGHVLAYTGSFYFGLTLGMTLAGEFFFLDWLISAALLTPGFILISRGQSTIEQAVGMYNRQNNLSNIELSFGPTQNGVGLTLNF